MKIVEPAFPVSAPSNFTGMSKREFFSLQILLATLTRKAPGSGMEKAAVKIADRLIKELGED